jgi:hypothetical protein
MSYFRVMIHRASIVGETLVAVAQLVLAHRIDMENAMRKRLCILAPLFCVALPALAAPNCTQQTTKGYWEATCDGYLTPPPPAPAALVPSKLLATCTASKTAAAAKPNLDNIG